MHSVWRRWQEHRRNSVRRTWGCWWRRCCWYFFIFIGHFHQRWTLGALSAWWKHIFIFYQLSPKNITLLTDKNNDESTWNRGVSAAKGFLLLARTDLFSWEEAHSEEWNDPARSKMMGKLVKNGTSTLTCSNSNWLSVAADDCWEVMSSIDPKSWFAFSGDVIKHPIHDSFIFLVRLPKLSR